MHNRCQFDKGWLRLSNEGDALQRDLFSELFDKLPEETKATFLKRNSDIIIQLRSFVNLLDAHQVNHEFILEQMRKSINIGGFPSELNLIGELRDFAGLMPPEVDAFSKDFKDFFGPAVSDVSLMRPMDPSETSQWKVVKPLVDTQTHNPEKVYIPKLNETVKEKKRIIHFESGNRLILHNITSIDRGNYLNFTSDEGYTLVNPKKIEYHIIEI